MSTQLDNSAYITLAGRIKASADYLLDSDEVAALIEAMGITDRIAQQDYGMPDVRALAASIKPLLHRRDLVLIPSEDTLQEPESERRTNSFQSVFEKLARETAPLREYLSRLHLEGFLFAMPMLVSIVGLLVLKAALWSDILSDLSVATAIGLGTIASFVVTGGYGQAIGRRGFFYRVQEEHGLARTVCYYFIGIGCQMSLLLGLVAFGLNTIFGLLSLRLALIALTYYFFLCMLWLFLAVLYMLGQPLVFTPIIVIGIVSVYILRDVVPSLVGRQSIAMMLVAVLSYLCGYTAFGATKLQKLGIVWATLIAATATVIFLVVLPSNAQQEAAVGACILALLGFLGVGFERARRQAQAESDLQSSTLPRASLLWYKVGPYFIYGILYYGFLVVDRLIVWSTPDLPPIQGGFVFRTSYEVGMSWGLIVLLCTMGLAESAIHAFSLRIREDEQRIPVEDPKRLTRIYLRFYWSRAALFAVGSTMASLALWYGMTAYAQHSTNPALKAFLEPIPRLVFCIATPGYALLSWSLFNNVFLFGLSRPEKVVPVILLALAVHATLSYTLTRVYGHTYAAVGFLVGTVVLAVLSTINVARVLRELDYYYYSAYL